MTPTQTHAAQVLTDAETDQHLDAVLNGAGSALRHYTTEFSLSRMRAAMREHEAAILAKLQPAQAGELPEPDAVFYCSEETGCLTQYRRPPANMTDGDVAMYEADTVRYLISAALAARKPLTDEAYKLWMLLDDIDTADDMAKADNDVYRSLVRRIHKQRFDILSGEQIDAIRSKL